MVLGKSLKSVFFEKQCTLSRYEIEQQNESLFTVLKNVSVYLTPSTDTFCTDTNPQLRALGSFVPT